MRERKLYEKKRARKGTGRAKTIPVQVSVELHRELTRIKGFYVECLGKSVTFEQLLWRWIDRLPRIDGDVSEKYDAYRESVQATEEGARETAVSAMKKVYQKMQSNGTSLMEEAKATLEEDLAAADSPAPAADQESPEPLDMATPEEVKRRWKEAYWFIDPEGHKVKAVIKTVQGEVKGFFPEKGASRNTNYRTLMNQQGWKMTDDQGNELLFVEAQEIVKEFEADHPLN